MPIDRAPSRHYVEISPRGILYDDGCRVPCATKRRSLQRCDLCVGTLFGCTPWLVEQIALSWCNTRTFDDRVLVSVRCCVSAGCGVSPVLSSCGCLDSHIIPTLTWSTYGRVLRTRRPHENAVWCVLHVTASTYQWIASVPWEGRHSGALFSCDPSIYMCSAVFGSCAPCVLAWVSWVVQSNHSLRL